MVDEGVAANVADDLVAFLNASPTPFHAVHEAKTILQAAGFIQLSEREDWSLVKGGKYFVTRNHSTIVAFAVGKLYAPGNGFGIVGAHTDSPCLKLKPVSKVSKGGFLEVGVQTYGGGLWHTWFDRDLTVAGRVILRQGADENPTLVHKLVRIQDPIMRVPTLAIHLDRTVSDGFKFNTQTHLVPVLATAIKAELSKKTCSQHPCTPLEADGVDASCKLNNKARCEIASTGRTDEYHHSLLLEILARELQCIPEEIYDFELSLCDTQASVIGGALKEFVFSGRLDNLCMCFCALKGLVDATTEDALGQEEGVQMVALFDHEEVGSNSAQGAGSPALFDSLTRITLSFSTHNTSQIMVNRAIQKSLLVSADMAHALHPNYPEKHEDNHQVRMHKGLVIKHNANQRYATNAVTATIFRHIGQKCNLPVQEFVVRNDMGCGSTIGPILASGVGIRTVDVGAPQLSMHSIREMCAVDDVGYTYEHFKAFFREFSRVDAKLAVDS